MAEWQFGDFLNDNYKSRYQEGYIETPVDAGRPYRRLTTTDSSNIVQGNIILNTIDDMTKFQSFYLNDTLQGSLTFDYYDCRYDITRTARFSDNPVIQTIDNAYVVNVKLMLDPSEITIDFNLLAENGNELLTEDGDNIIASKKVTI